MSAVDPAGRWPWKRRILSSGAQELGHVMLTGYAPHIEGIVVLLS